MPQLNTVLVTGSNRGIGLEFVRQYLAAGWRVFATCRSPERALDLAKLAADNPDALSLHPLDVTETSQVNGLKAVMHGMALDVLINNAGVLGPKEQGFGHTDVDAWAYTFKVNAVAPLKLIEALRDNLAAGRLRIAANLSSRMGSIADNDSGGYYIYRSSKAALNAALKSASLDLAGAGIRVVALHPGWVRTAMGGAGAETDPADSVRMMRRLIEGLGPHDSGRFLDLDGSAIPW